MHVDPTRDQFDHLKSLPRDEPISMLNLVLLRERAAYPDGREATGAEAYTAYGRESSPIFKRVGGELIWRGDPRAVLIGPESEVWHIAFMARYPTVGRFLEMVTAPDYQAIVFHRQAAVADSRLIAMGDRKPEGRFG